MKMTDIEKGRKIGCHVRSMDEKKGRQTKRINDMRDRGSEKTSK